MNVKTFLVPDWKKILLFLVLFLLIAFLAPIIPVLRPIMCITTPCDPSLDLTSLYSAIFHDARYIAYSLSTYVMIIVEVILSYLLSCFILFKLNRN